MWTLLAGVFLPDVVWIVLSALGVEPATASVFFDDWSHSLASVLVLATVYALCFVRMGTAIWLPAWAAVVSHFVLDAIIHPKPIALYPHSSVHLPWDLWRWGQVRGFLGFTHYWLVQFVVILPLLAIYVAGMRRERFALNLVTASVLIVLMLHLVL